MRTAPSGGSGGSPTSRWRAKTSPSRAPGGYLPEGTHWWQQRRPSGNRTNDYFIDREAQRKVSFSGIPGFPLQDKMATESMGPIMDRTTEHLGTTDAVIIAMRRRLLAAARALRDQGITPPGVDQPDAYAVRSAIVNLPVELNWVEASREMVTARPRHRCRQPCLSQPSSCRISHLLSFARGSSWRSHPSWRATAGSLPRPA